MNTKKIVKNLIHFAKREFSQKRPLKVKVLRMKEETILTKGGPLKKLKISSITGALFIVLVEYHKEIRIYYYSKEGKLLGAQNFDRKKSLLENIKKSTVKEFEILK